MRATVEKIVSQKPVRFLIAGGSAAAVEYVVFLVMMLLSSAAAFVVVSQIASYLCGFVVSFWLQRNWVYKSAGPLKKELTKYLLLALINLLLSGGVIWLLVDVGSVQPFIAKIIVMIMVAAWNYVIFGKIIFRENKKVER